MPWICPECETEAEDTDSLCPACDEPRPADANAHSNDDDDDDDYRNIKVGLVVRCEDAPGTKLKRLKVTVDAAVAAAAEAAGGADAAADDEEIIGKCIDVVTAATNVAGGARVVVACVGAVVKGEPVVKCNVKGFPSAGMLCDPAMLGWQGGGAGAAVLLPDSFPVGSRPPSSRPRKDQ